MDRGAAGNSRSSYGAAAVPRPRIPRHSRRAASRWRTHEYTALDLDLDLDAAAEGDPIL